VAYAFQPLISMGTNLFRNGDGLSIQSGQISGRMDTQGVHVISLDQVYGITIAAGRVPGSTDTRASSIRLDPGIGGVIDGRAGGTQYAGFYFDTNEYSASHIMMLRGPIYLRDGTDINHSIQYEATTGIDGTMFKAWSSWRWYSAATSSIVATIDRNGNMQNTGWLGSPAGSATGRAPVLLSRGGGDQIHFDVLSGRLEVYVNGSRNFSFGASLGKTFIINHPYDSNRYLIHAAIEGPENAVYYRGVVDLIDGRAVVELPKYFEHLTHVENRTVQVSPLLEHADSSLFWVGATTPKNGYFTIKASSRTGRVSWEVKAERKDTVRNPTEPLKSDIVVNGFGPYLTYRKK